MTPLRKELIRLAREQPELRVHLVPLIRKVASEVNVGDVMVSSWGYGQTNVSFYQVVRTTAKMVVLRSLYSKIVGGQGKPQENVMPVLGRFGGQVFRKKLLEYNRVPYVKITTYESAYLWDGKPATQTGLAYGN